MTQQTTAYLFRFTVRSCAERTSVIRTWKDADGKAQSESESIGYFCALDPGNLTFALGEEKPGLSPGDSVELVLRPARRLMGS